MDLKNIQISDLKEKLQSIDKKTLIKFGIGFGSIVLFLIIYYSILNPMVEKREAKYQDKILKEKETEQFQNDIISMKKTIKKLTPEFKKFLHYFTQKLKLKTCIIV